MSSRARTPTATLSHAEAKAFYDRFGAKQDGQGWYEDAAIDALLARSEMGSARSVIEFGCGTGRLAARLLADVLPPECRYVGMDQSRTMVELASSRIGKWSDRATVVACDGAPRLAGVADGGADRVLSTYVLDLLSLEDIEQFLKEARRVLAPGGRLCLTGLTFGERGAARLVTALWTRIHAKAPAKVGGCRPLRMKEHLPGAEWKVVHREVVTRWGIASEVVVAESSRS